jgi:hypothetical protein
MICPGRVRVILQEGFGHRMVTLALVKSRVAFALLPHAHVQNTSAFCNLRLRNRKMRLTRSPDVFSGAKEEL